MKGVSDLKKVNRKQISILADELRRAEDSYVLNPSPLHYQLWRDAQRQHELALVTKTQKWLLYQRQRFFDFDVKEFLSF